MTSLLLGDANLNKYPHYSSVDAHVFVSLVLQIPFQRGARLTTATTKWLIDREQYADFHLVSGFSNSQCWVVKSHSSSTWQLKSLICLYTERHLHNRHLRIITYRKILYAKRAICAQCWKFYNKKHVKQISSKLTCGSNKKFRD